MGAAAPISRDGRGEWDTFNGNQLGVLLANYVLRNYAEQRRLTPSHYIVTTLVTTQMLNRIARSYGVRCYDNNLVGFKWIANVMDQVGPDEFVFGTEESHGFLVGQYCRDKDGAVACMLMSELAAWVKSQGLSLFEHLDQLYLQHGYHAEDLLTIQMAGSDGMRRMKSLMDKFRSEMPNTLAGLKVSRLKDFLNGEIVTSEGVRLKLDGPRDNLIILETELDGNYVAARPSGTEPKVKFYMFTYVPSNEIESLSACKSRMARRLTDYATALRNFADLA
jgi:phosphoglucomutase/phosphomannomutase